MEIGTCIHFHAVRELPEKLAALRAEGFSSCQLICWHPSLFTADNAAAVREKLKTAGVTVTALWCGWSGPCVWDFYEGPRTIGLVPPATRDMRVRELCAGGDFAHRIGVRDVVTHMGFIPEDPQDPLFAGFCEAVRTVAQHLAVNGSRLLFETGQETPVTLLRTLETVGCDNVGINLDTANLILYGRGNPVDALEVFGRYVYNLHAKDGRYPVNGRELGTETRIGDGAVNFLALFQKLYALGYDGPVTIEREINGTTWLQDVRCARDYLSRIIETVYGQKPAKSENFH